ncbi:radical SAM/CxCxxxxC motif protein YfkAB [Mangrovibacillus cuniculi]|uniref:Radical SAM/CxCxxxxC motif protein YfkAB n=1 Tax=Mangrovibacillus cuniculi TaxID=2593652 RepID=A0A7S8C9B3_9BACI|nr:radical SAM/CxCxxxxC motif protein YfkAB [Mangrovibacillus cuniculi]QPC45764.1 radical SAM/CxCxxxxC motif protein YfkAB [Mangrovibacillus cuniculi]
MKTTSVLPTLSPSYDPWEAYMDVKEHGKMTLSNIEFTTTTLCNMRCAHCAVGYTLSPKDPTPLPMDLITDRLDEIPHLRTLSITGGEPMMSKKSIEQVVIPLLKYAKSRGVRTQINSNLTLDYDRYEMIIPYLDVLHISHNWGTVDEFIDVGFAMMERKPSREQRKKLFDRMIENSRRLSEAGVLVSAETMLNKNTLPYLESIYDQIVNEMKCKRVEIHPMYPSDFASNLEVLSLDELRAAISSILSFRNPDVWTLFGTLPFYHCSPSNEDQEILRQLREAKNVTVRNDPDGRSRLNVNIFTGDVIVTDFGDTPALGNIEHDSLPSVFNNWMETKIAKELNCHCPSVACLGPNILVKNAYYPDVDFQKRVSKV